MTPVIYRPEAAADIIEAAGWYERRQAGLGSEFLSEVKNTADRARNNLCNVWRFTAKPAAPWSKGFPMGVLSRA